MKNVLLSADGPVNVYSLPDEAADDLHKWIDHFYDWMQSSPEAARYRNIFPSGTIGLCFNERDFIQYLNNVAFPDQPSVFVQEVEEDNIPEAFRSCPWFSF